MIETLTPLQLADLLAGDYANHNYRNCQRAATMIRQLAARPTEAVQQGVPEGWAEALVRYNDNARSFFQIANLVATELGTHALQTNFGAFAETTKRMLDDTHAITNEARARISKGKP